MDLDRFYELGYVQIPLELPREIKNQVLMSDYQTLDQSLGNLLKPNGELYQSLSKVTEIFKTEYLIAVRSGADDEDGIWHDDGSRDLAFTLSLVLDLGQLEGGELLFKKKESDNIIIIPTAPYGTLTIIKTGKEGYEHRVKKVTKGKRIICAGWIN